MSAKRGDRAGNWDWKTLWLSVGALFLFSACDSGPKDGAPLQPNSAERTSSAIDASPIAPKEFVIAPCVGVKELAPCAIVAAGGKRVLIGTPAGVGDGKIKNDVTPPDAIVLFSLHANAIEGLDEIRNRSWTTGRRSALLVAGPEGIEAVVSGLNAAYVTSDALAYVSGDRAGGFDTEPITAKTIRPGDLAFDTGDLMISALSAGPGTVGLLVQYKGKTALLSDCGVSDNDVKTWPTVDVYIGCAGRANSISGRLVDFPPQRRIYIEQIRK